MEEQEWSPAKVQNAAEHYKRRKGKEDGQFETLEIEKWASVPDRFALAGDRACPDGGAGGRSPDGSGDRGGGAGIRIGVFRGVTVRADRRNRGRRDPALLVLVV